jgi:hypothetical protein
VTTAIIIPAGDNNIAYIVEGEIWAVACAADSSRPVAYY